MENSSGKNESKWSASSSAASTLAADHSDPPSIIPSKAFLHQYQKPTSYFPKNLPIPSPFLRSASRFFSRIDWVEIDVKISSFSHVDKWESFVCLFAGGRFLGPVSSSKFMIKIGSCYEFLIGFL